MDATSLTSERLAELGLPTSFGRSGASRSGGSGGSGGTSVAKDKSKQQSTWAGFGKKKNDPPKHSASSRLVPSQATTDVKPKTSTDVNLISNPSHIPQTQTKSTGGLQLLAAYDDSSSDEENETHSHTKLDAPQNPPASRASEVVPRDQIADDSDADDFGPSLPSMVSDSTTDPSTSANATVSASAVTTDEQDFGRGSIKRIQGQNFATPAGGDDGSAYEDEDEDADDDEEAKAAEALYQTKLRSLLPTTHETELRLYGTTSSTYDADGSRVGPVTALAIDGNGVRLAAGTATYDVKLFDFAEMDSRLLPLRSFVPCDGYPLKYLGWNPAYSTSIAAAPAGSSLLLAVTGATEARVFSRDGTLKHTFARGYPYVRDLSATEGHKAPCTGGAWHPKQFNYCITSSEDGSIRQWDLATASKSSVDLMKVKPKPGKRAVVTACCYSADGNSIAGAALDGSVHVWDSRRGARYVFTSVSIEHAHQPDTWTSSLIFAPHNDKVLLSRGGDHTLKVWDLRNPSKCLCSHEGLLNSYDTTNMAFSPDGRFLITGSSSYQRVHGKSDSKTSDDTETALQSTIRDTQIALRVRSSFSDGQDDEEEEEEEEEEERKEKQATTGPISHQDASSTTSGRLHIFQSSVWTPLQEITIGGGSVIQCTWDERTNQIYTGTSSGVVKALYTPGKSRGGVITASRTARKKDFSEFVDYSKLGTIIAPAAEGQTGHGRVRRPGMRRNEESAAAPAPPAGRNAMGYIPSSLQHHFLKNLVHKTQIIANEDPREALLRYADAPKVYTAAYNETQPVPIFREDVNEVEVDLKGKGTHKQGGKTKLD